MIAAPPKERSQPSRAEPEQTPEREDWERYEEEKAKLCRLPLSPTEYEQAIEDLTREMKI